MKTLLRLFLLIALLTPLLCAGRAFPVIAQQAAGDFSQIDEYIRTTMQHLPIKGIALAIVRDDQVLYMQGYGIANAQGDPATPQTPWRMGSITKSFTALAIQQLIEQGKISPYAPVQKYLPEFRLADSHGGALVTVRNLLNHTSGISEEEGNQPYFRSSSSTFEKSIEQLAHYKPADAPGEHYAYSNWNYVLLAQIVARNSGQPFDRYVQEHILDPMGMTHSTFRDPHTLPHAATGSQITFGFPVPYDEPYEPNILGAGNLVSTAEDMTHFVMLHLNAGQYQGHYLLREKGQGLYSTMWDWSNGVPDPTADPLSVSGGYNSITTTCLFFPAQKVGVVLLLNATLDQMPTGFGSYEIARGVASLLTGLPPYQLPPYNSFYLPWMILDAIFLTLLTSILWQVSHLKHWRNQYQSAIAGQQVIAWIGIVFDLLTGVVLLFFPVLTNTRWNSVIYFRPDFGIPLLILALGHVTLGIGKIALILSPAWFPRQNRKSSPQLNVPMAGSNHQHKHLMK